LDLEKGISVMNTRIYAIFAAIAGLTTMACSSNSPTACGTNGTTGATVYASSGQNCSQAFAAAAAAGPVAVANNGPQVASAGTPAVPNSGQVPATTGNPSQPGGMLPASSIRQQANKVAEASKAISDDPESGIEGPSSDSSGGGTTIRSAAIENYDSDLLTIPGYQPTVRQPSASAERAPAAAESGGGESLPELGTIR
jgi:hypothetical protein